MSLRFLFVFCLVPALRVESVEMESRVARRSKIFPFNLPSIFNHEILLMFMQYNQRKGLSNNYIKLRRDFPISTDAELPNQTNQAKSKMKY